MRRRAALGAIAAITLSGSVALGQVHAGRPTPPPQRGLPQVTLAPPGVRERFGVDSAMRLLRSPDPAERLRGLERAAATRTPEALAILERAAGATAPGGFDAHAAPEGIARKDPRALLVVVRGLASWADQESAREALAAILVAQTPSFTLQVGTSADPAGDEAIGSARVLLARQQAAIALASSGRPLALEALVAAARSGGPGQEPALEALALVPPTTAVLGGVALTTAPTIALAAESGDLRSIDPVGGVLGASDPSVRAAALAALSANGDARVVGPARDQMQDSDPRVRVAAAEALARLGAPQAETAVAALVADDTTALDGLRVALLVQGQGVTKAAAARAAATSDLGLRAAALQALGRQVDPLAVQALVTLARDPVAGGDAMGALARSPSGAAMGALEAMSTAPDLRRLAARAYLVRRVARGDRSERLDALLSTLARSAAPGDRAVGVQALVVLGQLSLGAGLGDPDPRVQRGAAMGALALPAEQVRAAAAAALATVRDRPTGQLLALLGDGAGVSTLDLVDRAQSGGADAPAAAMALARRDDEPVRPVVDSLLASRDPLLRSHAARGLALSPSADAVGRLAAAYTFEADLEVRRALVVALAARTLEADAPARREALALASRLDPDRIVHVVAARAEASLPGPAQARGHEIAWLRVVPATGASLPASMVATVVGADGLARPVVFDEEGYALVPGLPPGEARVRLAPALPAYESH